MTGQKGGASALGLQRVLGLGSYRTGWSLLHKLRRAMVRPGRDRLQGVVEVDEIFIGGPRPGKRGRGAQGKALVVIAAQQAAKGIGRIRLTRVAHASASSLEAANRRGRGGDHRRHGLPARHRAENHRQEGRHHPRLEGQPGNAARRCRNVRPRAEGGCVQECVGQPGHDRRRRPRPHRDPDGHRFP